MLEGYIVRLDSFLTHSEEAKMERTESKEICKQLAYHAACASQYQTMADSITDEQRHAKVLENIKWHRDHIAYLEARKAR